ncbi:transporter substrate-binding domain-containing protein [Clostridium vitabionis]|uniref:transporter substrate-binding domain-containing protein n=1 Tax=Clostridium vitabionis TaxID=2784388 RepID=UPI00188A6A6B|nr:transporter substrate-binding domain-containing protein [Clostridium vitabionis]
MRKRLISGILAGILAMSMAACGGSGSSAKTTAAGASSAAETTEAASKEAASGASSEAASGDSDVAYIKGKGTMIVGITDFEPMDYKEQGSDEWIGFDADLARKVAEDLGVEAQFVEIDWDNKILEMENKSVDVVWNGMTLTDEVTKSLSCTKPYLNNAQVVVVPSDVADKYQDKDSLKDLNFAVEVGSAGKEAAEENGLKTTEVSSQADALMNVQAKTADAAIIDLLMAGAMIGDGTSYPNLTHTVELSTEEYGIGCRKGSDLTDFIDEELDKFRKDGSLKELAEKYGVQDALVD